MFSRQSGPPGLEWKYVCGGTEIKRWKGHTRQKMEGLRARPQEVCLGYLSPAGRHGVVP
jgi:hypothetical protein